MFSVFNEIVYTSNIKHDVRVSNDFIEVISIYAGALAMTDAIKKENGPAAELVAIMEDEDKARAAFLSFEPTSATESVRKLAVILAMMGKDFDDRTQAYAKAAFANSTTQDVYDRSHRLGDGGAL